MTPLTRRQSRVLNFIKRHIESKGYPPSWMDVSTELGSKNPNTGSHHLKALARKGYIKWETGKARTLKIIKEKS